MTADVILAVLAALGVGLLGALATLHVARRSLRWASIMSPLTIIASIAAGMLVGVHLMVIEGAREVFLIVVATAPVALLVGIFVSLRSQKLLDEVRAREEEEKRLAQIEAGRRELITWLSHDLRTPLAGIRAMGEALEDGIVPDPGRYYRLIVSEAERTSDMVSDLMALANLQTGKRLISKEAVGLADLLSDMLSQLAPLAESRGIAFDVDVPNETVEIFADASLITRALQNILANAINYSHPSSRITVVLVEEEGRAVLRVADQCGGISPEEKKHLFDVGWRGNQARTPDGVSGSGLGLPIVATIVSSHGGKISVDDAPGGCVVRMEIPKL